MDTEYYFYLELQKVEIDAIFAAVDDVYIEISADLDTTDDDMRVPPNYGQYIQLPEKIKCYDSLIIEG
ncbi:hypothetical protein F9B74_08670 [Pelistega sp. NLN82]|uniref:Uncharacterized protein n=1 Tax=Pelistega ratti TaxID=2652177 RepID=A0A6L9Y9C8_9BURK|nr:hypothetical protein [Pelistega ratti]NEN76388.1 hypothetical protein [Pelistega ratti]